MTPEVHQVLARAEDGAVGQHALLLRGILRDDLGVASDIYAADHAPGWDSRPLAALPGDDGLVLYHHATGSTVAEHLQRRAGLLVVDHHGITPPSWFQGWSQEAADLATAGQAQLRRLSARAVVGVAHSRFTETDLRRARYQRSEVLPVLFREDLGAVAADPATAAALARAGADGLVRVLVVGRVAPHKGVHDAIKAVAAYRAMYGPGIRLDVVGAPAVDTYARALVEFAAALDLRSQVTLHGAVDPARLAAHYDGADVLLALSDHEGFAVPLLEAWRRDVPVVTFAAGSLPETAGDAAVVLPDKQPSRVAAAIARVRGDADVRDALRARGRARLEQLGPEAGRRQWRDALASML